MQAVNPPCGLGFKQIVVLEKLLEPARGQPLPLGAPGEHRAESLLAGRLRLDEPVEGAFPGHGSRAATAGFSGLHGNSNHSVLGNFLVSLQRLCAILGIDFGLSAREVDVLELLVLGKDAKAIADELFISFNTVRSHIRRIYGKLDVHSRQELLDKVRGQAE